MLAQRRRWTEAGGRRRGTAAGMDRVSRDKASLAGCLGADRARRVLRCSLTVLLIYLLAMPAFASSETAPRAAPVSASAAPGDEYWAAGFNLPGMDGDVHTLAVGPDGSLYAGGWFTTAGGVAANAIARWAPATSSWHPLGSGMEAYDNSPHVYALAFGPDGSLYAGGWFTTAGGVAANAIARWDPATSSWHPLGSGMEDYLSSVCALAFGPDGSLYAGGYFTTAGGVAANSIARWDGTQWNPLGSGMDGDVCALAVGPDGQVYAGGGFTTAGGVAASHIARWDPATSSWHPLGGGVDHWVFALAFGPDGSLYAGGYFTSAGGVAASRIARWDAAASSWHTLGSGMGGGDFTLVCALAFGRDGSLYAGGGFITAGGVAANSIARWDPVTSSWHPLGSGMNEPVRALAFGPDGLLYAGGDFTWAGGVHAKSIARWDPTTLSWQPPYSGSGMNNDVHALAFGPDGSLYAGGKFTTAGGAAANYIARWDPATSSWYPLGSGMNGDVSALAFGPDGSLYAGGRFRGAGGLAANYIARWDPATSSWHPLGSGMGGAIDPLVDALAVGPDGQVYAGGYFTTAGGVAASHIARWDPATSTWHSLGSGMNSYVEALVVGPDGSLYAGGGFQGAGNFIARWDPATSSWHRLGSGMDYWVFALAFGSDGALYVGGHFNWAGGVAANAIARWDGSQWHPLGSGMAGADNPSVGALAFGPDGSLYAGGDFTTAGGVAANYIARWDGSQWHPLGSGMAGGYEPSVDTLAFGPDNSLYAGGRFTTAGGKPSSYIARWAGSVVRVPVAWFPVAIIDQ